MTLLAVIALSAVLGADANYPTGTRGLLLIDKVGSYIRFFDPARSRSDRASRSRPSRTTSCSRPTGRRPTCRSTATASSAAIRIRATRS